MFKLIRKQTALLVLMMFATMATAQTVNMSRYITLTVQQGEQIWLNFAAAAAGTGVKIISGSTNQTITVGTGWIGSQNYTAGAGTMTVYGDITWFACNGNGTRLTALDVSHNTALTVLNCSDNQLTSLDVSQNTALEYLDCDGNHFTTQAFNDLMCSLPARTTADDARFRPLYNASDASHAAFMAANSQIATAKNWQVRYWQGNGEIPATTGTYVCGGGSGSVNMSRYITLTVTQGQQIRLDLRAAAAGTGVKIISGSTETVVTVGTDWTDFQNYTAGAGTMTVYGDITRFDCSGNGAKLTALDVSHNTAIIGLWCYDNQLTALDVSHNTALKYFRCNGNNFTTQAFNDLMCSLPTRTTADNAKFYPLWNASDAAASAFMAANSQIAIAKNWQVRYWTGSQEAIPATTGTYTCPVVNMNRYITLTVQQGQQIQLGLWSAAAGTPVKIVSGSTNRTITVGTGLAGFQNYTAGSTTMTVYGDITGFYCSDNGTKLTALNVSHNTALKTLLCQNNQITSLDVTQNTALKKLVCYGNSFTVQAFNDLMCSLPARTTADNAKFYPLWNASDAGASAFMAANSQIATAKNWQVRYYEGSEAEIPATTGTYVCGGGSGSVNMSKYITLTVQQGQQIQLDLQAAAAGTGVKIVSGSTNQTITVGTNWTGYQYCTAGAGTMTVYGDITGFDCSGNGAKLTALDVSQNTALTGLWCRDNQLTSLDVSHNTALTGLYCSGNQLTALDVSHNTALKGLSCYGNPFTTQAFNDIMCSLPARTTADGAKFYPLLNASDAAASAFMAANSQIAKNKNWQVNYAGYNLGAIPATTGTYVCGGGSGSVNMSKYITLTVQQGEQIELDLKAAAAGTGVKIVSGSTNTVVTVGTSWTGFRNYTAGAGTMTVYGDITGFDCSGNGAKLTALDVSQNTALTTLVCWGNQLTALDVSQNTALTTLVCSGNSFTTQAFNDLMCSLPARTTTNDARFYPLWNASDAAASAFMAANSQIAIAKNWQVLYGADGAAVPATTGTYTCPTVNMSKYITLTVQQGEQIQLNLKAAAANTPVKIVSGSNETVVTVGTSWTDFRNYTAGAGTMTIYGDITGFDCSDNEAKLTALDVNQNTALTTLICGDNRLTTLDISQNTALTTLYCGNNQLTSLDVSRNTALIKLNCRGNNFTVQGFNDLMCSLPARTAADGAKFYPLYNASDAKYADFMAANSQIATGKNWQVRYRDGSGAIPATTGTYVCGTGIGEVAAVPLAVYPNPATDILTVETEATGSVITLTDLTGRTVMTATATGGKTVLNLSELSAGTYIVRVGNRVGKIVKR